MFIYSLKINGYLLTIAENEVQAEKNSQTWLYIYIRSLVEGAKLVTIFSFFLLHVVLPPMQRAKVQRKVYSVPGNNGAQCFYLPLCLTYTLLIRTSNYFRIFFVKVPAAGRNLFECCQPLGAAAVKPTY
jgi:hypothetical protein